MTIPADWTEAVRVALREAFGVEAADALSVMSGGLSGAPVLRIAVGGRDYILRLDAPESGFGDPRRWHRCMEIAAEAGAAPAVRYAGESGVSIVDFVTPPAGGDYWSGDRGVLLRDLGHLLARLHAAPAFPPLIEYLDGLGELTQRVADAGLLSPAELAGPMDRFAALAEAYRALEPQPVSSHNDVNPRNLVHDGQRLWLVDWLSAFQADRYIDLAAIGSFMARDPESEAAFLAAYFGRPATAAEQARMYLAKQVNHLFYAMSMLPTAGGARPERVRPLDDLHDALRAGEAVFDSAVGRAEYSLSRLAAMVAGVEAPGFELARRLAA